MNAAEVLSCLNNEFAERYTDDGFWGELSYELQKYNRETKKYEPTDFRISGFPLEIVEDVGGGEGDGDTRYLVFKLGSQFFRKDGYYASYDGSVWDGDFYEVFPREKTITVYEDKTPIAAQIDAAWNELDSFDSFDEEDSYN